MLYPNIPNTPWFAKSIPAILPTAHVGMTGIKIDRQISRQNGGLLDRQKNKKVWMDRQQDRQIDSFIGLFVIGQIDIIDYSLVSL